MSDLITELNRFKAGYNDSVPSEDVIKSAESLITKSMDKAIKYEFEYNNLDGSLIFDIRLQNGTLLLGSVHIDGNIHANLYDDMNPDKIAPLNEIWLKYMPNVTLEELFELF